MRGRKANLSQRAQELCATVALQGAAPWASCGDGLGRAGGSRSPRCPARYQQRLCVPQSKAGSFACSRVRKSAVGPESGCPACVRLCRRTSVPGAIASRYRRVPPALPLPGAGPVGSGLHRAALGWDWPQAGGDCSLCPSRARSTTDAPSLRPAERRSPWGPLWPTRQGPARPGCLQGAGAVGRLRRTGWAVE